MDVLAIIHGLAKGKGRNRGNWSPVFLKHVCWSSFVLFGFRAQAGDLFWAWLLQFFGVLLPVAPGEARSPLAGRAALGLLLLYFVASYSNLSIASCWEVFQTELKGQGITKSLEEPFLPRVCLEVE